MTKITQKEFMKKFMGAPLTLDEIAFECTKIKDNQELSDLAYMYLEAMDNFEGILKEIGYEFG